MNNGIEKVLQVDALREAVGRDEDARFGVRHRLHPCTAILRCKKTGHALDANLWEGLAKAGRNVIRRRNEPAKHNRL